VSEATPSIDGQARVLRIRFFPGVPAADDAFLTFNDPAPGYAVVTGHPAGSAAANADGSLDVLLLPPTAVQPATPADAQAIAVKYRGVDLTWRPGHATLQCDPTQTDALLPALVEFAHYESELRRIEQEIAAGWTELEQDKTLAFDITPADLARSEAVGARMNRAFGRRIRYARIEPHLYEPGAALSAAGQKLGAELREKARIESRLETIDGQLEVYEHVYEMSAQRLGEYRAAREEHTLEWIIIVLLAAEFLALLAQMVWRLKP
jgi:hypothetical protein